MRINFATLLFFIANGIVVVAIPPYLRDLGVISESTIGTIISTAFFVSVIVRPLSGFIGDKVGYVKVMRIGVVFAVMSQIMYLLSNPLWVQIGRVFHGFAIGTFLPMSIAISVTEGAKAMATRSLAVGIGNVVGPLVGSILYDLGGGRLSITVALLLHTINWFFINGAVFIETRGKGGDILMPETRVFFFTALLTIYATVYMGISTFTPLRLKDEGLPITYWGLFSSTAAISSLIPRAFLLRMGFVNHITAGLASAITMAGLALVAVARDLPLFLVAGAIYGLGQGAVVVTYQILALAGSRNAGLASAVYTMGWDLGSIIGPIFAGMLVEHFGYGVLYYVPLLLLANMGTLFIYALHKRKM